MLSCELPSDCLQAKLQMLDVPLAERPICHLTAVLGRKTNRESVLAFAKGPPPSHFCKRTISNHYLWYLCKSTLLESFMRRKTKLYTRRYHYFYGLFAEVPSFWVQFGHFSPKIISIQFGTFWPRRKTILYPMCQTLQNLHWCKRVFLGGRVHFIPFCDEGVQPLGQKGPFCISSPQIQVKIPFWVSLFPRRNP